MVYLKANTIQIRNCFVNDIRLTKKKDREYKNILCLFSAERKYITRKNTPYCSRPLPYKFFRIRSNAPFSKRDTCAWLMPMALETSFWVLPS